MGSTGSMSPPRQILFKSFKMLEIDQKLILENLGHEPHALLYLYAENVD